MAYDVPSDVPVMVCSRCGAPHATEEKVWRCACGGALDLRLPAARVSPALARERPMTLWRYAEALPPLAERVSLGESVPPLVPIEHRGRTVWLKCDYLLPTGAYKDRGAAVLMSHLKAIGVRRAVEDSSGNAAASLAAYAARAGIDLLVFCPATASPGKLAQVRLYGAALRLVEGPRQRTTEALEAHVADTGDFYASHLWHPFFVEGVKTVAFEIAEQRGWRPPDAVLCPVGAGSILLGLHQGFAELARAGVVPRVPRLFAIQAANVAPVADAFVRHAADVAPAAAPRPTLAEGIALPRPVRGPEVLRALRETGGGVATVSEAAIRQGLLDLGRRGFCVEPTSAVVLPGLEALESRGLVRPDEEVVLVLSGFGLKASAALQELTSPKD
jgi:threonine synthase